MLTCVTLCECVCMCVCLCVCMCPGYAMYHSVDSCDGVYTQFIPYSPVDALSPRYCLAPSCSCEDTWALYQSQPSLSNTAGSRMWFMGTCKASR